MELCYTDFVIKAKEAVYEKENNQRSGCGCDGIADTDCSAVDGCRLGKDRKMPEGLGTRVYGINGI